MTLADLEIRNYRVGDQEAAISAHGTTGWVFRDLQVHDNGTSATVAPGRTRRRLHAFSAAVTTTIATSASAVAAAPNGWIIDGAEIDHNNFTDNTTRSGTPAAGTRAAA